jgi:hypothetical protein
MKKRKLTLQRLNQRFSICRLPGNSPVPAWTFGSGFWSVSGSEEEVSIVCPEQQVPEGIEAEQGWKAFRVKGILDMSLTGVLASLLQPLAEAEISVFAISTYNTDYVMVKEERYDDAASLLADQCTIVN